MGVCLQPSAASLGAAKNAVEFLLRTRNSDGGWSYTPGQASMPEPSCYGNLAICQNEPNLQWLNKQIFRPKGGEADPQWALSLALITLSQLKQQPALQKSLVDTLLRAEVKQTPSDNKKVDIDGSLRGWSWVEGTFSWVEPTSYALLALKGAGVLAHPRVQEAERLLMDRTCTDGGWNYGNRVVWGATLKSMTSTTAVATLALQRAPRVEGVVRKALDLLDSEVQSTPSTLALALTVLCFHAYGRPSAHLNKLLVARQRPDGSWRGQPHLTGLALLAMQAAEGGRNVFKL